MIGGHKQKGIYSVGGQTGDHPAIEGKGRGRLDLALGGR